jgi:hypothetical protein
MTNVKSFIQDIPIIGFIVQRLHTGLAKRPRRFRGSRHYWIQRYASGGTSGPGSYNRLADFKSEVLNALVKQHGITTIIEYGCGDGNQLRLAQYPSYLGFDVSPKAISLCRNMFVDDPSKTFRLMDAYAGEKAQLTLSLDVIFHLVEDDVFSRYMERLFDSSTRLVVIYSSNFDDTRTRRGPQLKHRQFSKWIEDNRRQWRLIDHIPNRYPLVTDPYNESRSDFYVYQKG